MSRGYYGLAFYEPKTPGNFGAAMRSAHCFGASFIALIGGRYARQPADTTYAERHVPLFQFSDIDAFLKATPRLGTLVGLEVDAADDLRTFDHPERAIYLLGGEDRTLPTGLPGARVRIDTPLCLNMAVAASIILYDRSLKRRRTERHTPHVQLAA